MRTIPSAYLKNGEENRLLRGHPWVYDNEIGRIAGKPEPGDEIHLFASNKRFLGTGFFSPASKIRVRKYSDHDIPFSEETMRSRLLAAIAVRKACRNLASESSRLVFAEADGFPGLIVDRYVGLAEGKEPGSWLSLQVLSAAMERHKNALVELLIQELKPTGIHERSDGPPRRHEGLEPAVGVLYGAVPATITIMENGSSFAIDLISGQKTGWFLDQKENRAAVAAYAAGKEVLDVFSNEGGFSMAAARAGAKSILAVDSSSEAIQALMRNAQANGFAGLIAGQTENAFDFLRAADRGPYDLVILDPPAFAKSKSTLEGAMRGYKEINLRGMKLLRAGGILATFSCSYWLSRERLWEVLEAAAADAQLRIRYLQDLGQAPDHPVVSGYHESRYLKGFIVSVEPRF